jgi:hypothetical protein
MYRAPFVTPEILLIEHSMCFAPPLRRLPDALPFMRRLVSTLCGLC